MSGAFITATPAAVAKPGDYVARIDHFPHIMLCLAGDGRRCGKAWVAKDEVDLMLKTAERREHEATCNGGLIIATGMGGAHA
ncbi:MAG: hypothetical protein WA766_21540 [Candidatus Acidiferrales bacterium]